LIDNDVESLKNDIQSEDPIQIKNLTKTYGKFKAVDDISINIKENEILCLLGHNGAGKTTVIQMLTGFTKPTSGDIIVDEISLNENFEEARKNMGLC
jgi:ABC-type multidrug transport system ATPase subunit